MIDEPKYMINEDICLFDEPPDLFEVIYYWGKNQTSTVNVGYIRGKKIYLTHRDLEQRESEGP